MDIEWVYLYELKETLSQRCQVLLGHADDGTSSWGEPVSEALEGPLV